MIKKAIYEASNPVGEVASFAPEVAAVARKGDFVASEIWADASHEVALTVTASLRRVFDPGAAVAVSWTGSLFNAQDFMLEPLKQHLARMWPAARPLVPEGTALRGADLLARWDPPPMFNPLIHAS